MKRIVDVIVSCLGLVLAAPILLGFMIAIWLQDFHSPFYVADRIGRQGRVFRMAKLRSMVANADRSGVTSTSENDKRVTAVGRLIRALKLDEITQLFNVLKGEMSLVGPRPNVMRWGVELYTDIEKRLLTVRPGITDLASIVFADEGAILADQEDPDLAYNQLIRPWKSRLALITVGNCSMSCYLRIIWLTVVGIVSRPRALAGVQDVLLDLGADEELLLVASRTVPLTPAAPPGASHVVTSREFA